MNDDKVTTTIIVLTSVATGIFGLYLGRSSVGDIEQSSQHKGASVSEQVSPAGSSGNPNAATLLDITFRAICEKESHNNPQAHNKSENAKGIAQIRLIMIRDVNRILGREQFTHNDAYNPTLTRQIFNIYQRHYFPDAGPERWSKSWNSGPDCENAEGYWQDIRSIMEDIINAGTNTQAE